MNIMDILWTLFAGACFGLSLFGPLIFALGREAGREEHMPAIYREGYQAAITKVAEG